MIAKFVKNNVHSYLHIKWSIYEENHRVREIFIIIHY